MKALIAHDVTFFYLSFKFNNEDNFPIISTKKKKKKKDNFPISFSFFFLIKKNVCWTIQRYLK